MTARLREDRLRHLARLRPDIPKGLADLATTGESAPLPWIQVAPGAPYFVTERGEPWTPIGQNDAISWVEFNGLFRRRDLPSVEAHLRWLKAHGVTCLRLMLEYAQVKHRYFERPAGHVVPAMVTLWDDLFALCEKVGMRVLLTPFDTFWMWLRWNWHPYNVANGGPLAHPSQCLLCGATRDAIKARLSFAVERWGGSGALFAWDLWNEIHPAQAKDTADCFGEFIHDLSQHVRTLEYRLYGRSHPQTVSLFGPELWWRPHLPLKDPIFRHPDLDFASIHIYRHGTIDDPRNTVDPAISMGEVVREALTEIRDTRPFLDTEHGPIHRFKDKRRTLPAAFDDEYFRHMQWAHVASGGAGGGMRWPNRTPHTLTPGMREAQRALVAFEPLIDWARFRRRNISTELKTLSAADLACFGCSDGEQALVYLLRRDTIGRDGMVRPDAQPLTTTVRVPAMKGGRFRVTAFDTTRGETLSAAEVTATGGLIFDPSPFAADIAVAIRPA